MPDREPSTPAEGYSVPERQEIGGIVSSRARAGLMLAAWVLAVGAIAKWGAKHLWVAGLGVIVISLTAFAYTTFSDVARERSSNTRSRGSWDWCSDSCSSTSESGTPRA